MSTFTFIPLPNNRNHKLWKYFGFQSTDGKKIDEGQDKTVYCKIEGCSVPKIPYSGNTTNLCHHLQKLHPTENAAYLGSTKSVTPQITNFCRPPVKLIALESARGREITSSIVDFIVEDLRPVNAVTGSGFLKLMKCTAPEYTVASPMYYAGKISDRYALKVSTLQDMLSNVKTVAITCDLWTFQAQFAFLGLTMHFIDNSWKLTARYVDCYELPGDQHAATHISDALRERLEYWLGDNGLSRIISATSDNGLNMVNALTSLGVPVQIGCVSHTVHLAVDKGLKSPRVSRVMTKARKLVEHFSKSTKSTYHLRQMQIQSGKSEAEALVLIQDVTTRWTSSYNMLKRLSLLQDYVHGVLAQSDKRHVRELDFSAEESYQLRELCTALEPLSAAMQDIGGESYCSISLVLPLLHKLCTKYLLPTEDDTPVVYDFKTTALADLSERYTEPAVKSLMAAATALDPRFRDCQYIREREARAAAVAFAKEQLRLHAAEVPEHEVRNTGLSSQPVHDDDDAAAEPPAKRVRGEANLVSLLMTDDDDDGADVNADNQELSMEQQIGNYYSSAVSSSTDPLDYWRASAVNHPRLSALAKRLLAVPGSSVPSERMFSTAGQIVTDQRSRLAPDSVSRLLFLHKNSDL